MITLAPTPSEGFDWGDQFPRMPSLRERPELRQLDWTEDPQDVRSLDLTHWRLADERKAYVRMMAIYCSTCLPLCHWAFRAACNFCAASSKVSCTILGELLGDSASKSASASKTASAAEPVLGESISAANWRALILSGVKYSSRRISPGGWACAAWSAPVGDSRRFPRLLVLISSSQGTREPRR